MTDVNRTLEEAMKIDGVFAVALVDYESGLTLGVTSSRDSFDIELAATGNTQVVRSKISVMESLGIEGTIEDILITLSDQYHLIRPLRSSGNLFLYIALDRKKGNMGMARHKLSSLEKDLKV